MEGAKVEGANQPRNRCLGAQPPVQRGHARALAAEAPQLREHSPSGGAMRLALDLQPSGSVREVSADRPPGALACALQL